MTNLSYLTYFSLSYMIYIMIIMMISFIHPTMMILMMLFYSVILCTNLSPWKSSYIFPILFSLIMISGLLIIFLYFSSLVSNTKTQISLTLKPNTSWFIFMLSAPLLTKMFFMAQPFYQGYPPTDFTMLISYAQTAPASKMYSNPASSLTMISMFYLLVALISIIKISTPKIKSMRKMI